MKFECTVCGFVYDEEKEGTPWAELPEDWKCPVCAAGRGEFEAVSESTEDEGSPPSTPRTAESIGGGETLESYLDQWKKAHDDFEPDLAAIQHAAVTGETVIEPMRTRKPVPGWNEIQFCGAQLARLPRNDDEPVNTRTVIGPNAAHPLVIETPIFVSHMSFGALSREVKIALATGSAAVGTAMSSGEGGILPESLAASHRYIFEYVPNRYSVTEENLRAVDAIEIKIGQSAKPGLGGHLPGLKVTEEIAEIRGFPVGEDIISPARFPDIRNAEELAAKVAWLRETSGGKPIGIKIAAGHIEADLEIALSAGPDFITVDGRAGATGAAPKTVKDSTAIPTVYALNRARRFLDAKGAQGVSLVITGGLRNAGDFAKALALGADGVAIATAALIAAGCQQYRVCHTGRCPVGITTQDPELRSRLHIDHSANRLANYLRVATDELRDFARLTGRNDVHDLSADDLRTTSSEISNHTCIAHAGE